MRPRTTRLTASIGRSRNWRSGLAERNLCASIAARCSTWIGWTRLYPGSPAASSSDSRMKSAPSSSLPAIGSAPLRNASISDQCAAKIRSKVITEHHREKGAGFGENDRTFSPVTGQLLDMGASQEHPMRVEKIGKFDARRKRFESRAGMKRSKTRTGRLHGGDAEKRPHIAIVGPGGAKQRSDGEFAAWPVGNGRDEVGQHAFIIGAGELDRRTLNQNRTKIVGSKSSQPQCAINVTQAPEAAIALRK